MSQAITRRRFLQVETNLIGRKVGEVSRSGGKLDFETKPWKVRTFEIE
jgi:hypothetical protein